MLPIRWRAEAQTDLAATLDYIAERNPQSELDLYDDIERTVSQLPHHPYLYRLGRISGTRKLVAHPNYIAVYHVSAAVAVSFDWGLPEQARSLAVRRPTS